MITPSQIRQKKISTVEGGGYDRNEVNELLLEVIAVSYTHLTLPTIA